MGGFERWCAFGDAGVCNDFTVQDMYSKPRSEVTVCEQTSLHMLSAWQ